LNVFFYHTPGKKPMGYIGFHKYVPKQGIAVYVVVEKNV
jgi:hypothetical protein